MGVEDFTLIFLGLFHIVIRKELCYPVYSSLWARRPEVSVADLAEHDVGVLAVWGGGGAGAASSRESFVVCRYLLGYGISSWQFLYWYVSCYEFDHGASEANA